ncbi:hypothetical protein [Macrococcoides caseolyticum]|uniref:hypothetical protein n=1 Tax=Macrococcoides caseolyticum TaxID=69966 RepID=UPI000C31F939|nr:hypothetical protein [Macrococcus caseolyticus]PKE64246.1 hypothetical protein CW683_01335 [Macrococcus caseolyticus]
MTFNIDETIKKINQTVAERKVPVQVEIKKSCKPQWDFEQLEQIKDQQKEQAKQERIQEYAKLLYDENFVVVSNERLQELKMKERMLSKISGGMVSVLEDITEVIKHD